MSELTLQLKRKLNVNALAADLVLHGAEDMNGVLKAHGIDELDLIEQLEGNPALIAKIKQIKGQVEKDPKAVVRMKATSALEGHIPTLNILAADGTSETRDRLNAMRLLAELADALPRSDPSTKAGIGMVLNLNLGSLGQPSPVKPVNVIEMEP